LNNRDGMKETCKEIARALPRVQLLQTLLSIVERRHKEGDPLTVNLILVSFLENIDAGTVGERMLSPLLRAEYLELFPDRVDSW